MMFLYCFAFTGWVLACLAYSHARKAHQRAEEAVSGLVQLERQWRLFIVRWDPPLKPPPKDGPT